MCEAAKHQLELVTAKPKPLHSNQKLQLVSVHCVRFGTRPEEEAQLKQQNHVETVLKLADDLYINI